MLRSYVASNGSTASGFAPRYDSPGQWFNLAGGNAEVFRSSSLGFVDKTIAITDVNDSWLGHDGNRAQLIFVNAWDDTMSGFDNDTGAPSFRFSTPTPGPVGVAYDSTRDVYWYGDWTTNEMIGLDATAAHGGVATIRDRFSTAGQITRIAGATYNCLDDTLTTGGRDQGMQVAYDVSTKAVVAQWPVLGGSVNDPQGCGLSSESGITTTDFQDLNIRVHEGTTGIRPGVFAAGSVVTIINYANSESRALLGHSKSAGRSVIKGVLTCLERGPGLTNAGRIPLSGTPGSGQINIGVTGRAIQCGTLPSKRLSNLSFN